jgi:HSP20 family protein
MSEHFQPPMKHGGNENPLANLWKMFDQFLDERPLKKMMETMDEYFQQMLSHAYIPIDVHETKEEYTIIAHLPNVKRNQIELQFMDDYLQLIIHHHETVESMDEKGHVYQKRKMQKHISRTIPLPYPVSEKDVKASFQNGKLVIRLPQKRKYIEIE